MHAYRLSLLTLSLSLPLVLSACPAEEDNDDGSNDPMSSDSGTTAPPAPETTTGDPPETTTGTPPATTEAATDTGEQTSTGESQEESGTTKGGFVFDVGEIPEAPPLETECGKVDFVFVIDNSGSMGDEQANLVANFPAFIDGIQNNLEDVESYHVGIVSTDTYTYNVAGCQQLSSFVVQTGGSNSSNMVCGPYADGFNFITEADDLAASFTCAAQIGTSGSASERQMQAMLEAVQEVEGDPGECNEGFLRDDALLVIVIITDEPDNASVPSTPMEWYDGVLAAKLGIPENVVVVSLINTPGGMCPGSTATDIAAFTDLWGMNGFMADICTPDYAPIFQDAIAVIDVACENYIPPG